MGSRKTYILIYSMEQIPFQESNRFLGSQYIPHILWKPKFHYRIHKCPILIQIDPVHTPKPILRSSLILSSHLRLGFQVDSFPQVSPPKLSIHLYTRPYALHAPPISFFLILSPEKYLVRSTDH